MASESESESLLPKLSTTPKVLKVTNTEGSGLPSLSKYGNNNKFVEAVEQTSFFGTSENSMIWCNLDSCGLFMSFTVWCILLYCNGVILFNSFVSDEWLHGALHSFVVAMTLVAHMKVMFTNPGAVPKGAKAYSPSTHSVICGRCKSFRPPRAHHCTICGRCIVRMDHHCAWVNNCIGAKNQKHFILFLIYLHLASLYTLVLIIQRLYFCPVATCKFVREMFWNVLWSTAAVSFFAALFTFFMLLNQVQAIVSGLGAVDRQMQHEDLKNEKQQAAGGKPRPQAQPLRLRDIFGTGSILLWGCHTTVVFEDESKELGYTI